MRRLILLIPFLLAACHPPSQNRYGEHDVGLNATVEFGTVLSERPVEITGTNTGSGALVGAMAGGYGGSQIGNGGGSLGAALAGIVIGAFAGQAMEQAARDRDGIEYVIRLESGVTQAIAQNVASDDNPITVGQRVMVQTSGEYRRVLPAPARGR